MAKYFIDLRGTRERVEFDTVSTVKEIPELGPLQPLASYLRISGLISLALEVHGLPVKESLCFLPFFEGSSYMGGSVINTSTGKIGILFPLEERFYAEKSLKEPQPYGPRLFTKGEVNPIETRDAIQSIGNALESYIDQNWEEIASVRKLNC